MTGVCACGCGPPTRLAPQTATKRGWVKGQPVTFIRGHNGNRRTHGDSRHRTRGGIYNIWLGIKRRCFDERHRQWKDYGGRGISMCAGWRRSYELFRFWMGPRPTSGHTVDRIDNDGPYEPGNVRWATRQEQALNTRRRKGRLISAEGV